MTQYYHLDDSGDPGMDFTRNVSPYFALVMVQRADAENIPQLSTLRKQLHVPETFEFKYARTNTTQKAAFFKAIQPIEFRVRAVFVNKAMLSRQYREMDGQIFTINWIIDLTLRASELDISDDVLILDGASPDLKRNLRVEFSKRCNLMDRKRPFKKIQSGDSSREDGLQLADMLVGDLTKSCQGKQSDYYSSIAPKVVDLWRAP